MARLTAILFPLFSQDINVQHNPTIIPFGPFAPAGPEGPGTPLGPGAPGCPGLPTAP